MTRRRKENSFARIGMMALALVLALGIMGTGYGIWTTSVSVNGTAETGEWTEVLSVEDYFTLPTATDNITCSASGNLLEISIANAQMGTNYFCIFVEDNTGTVPVKIIVDTSTVPEGVTTQLTIQGLSVDNVVDPGEVELITARIYLTATPSPNPSEGTDFTINILAVPWNQQET